MTIVIGTWLRSSGTKQNSIVKNVDIQNTAKALSHFQDDV